MIAARQTADGPEAAEERNHLADLWLTIGAREIELAKREVEKAGHEATMEVLARTGGRL